MGRRRCIFEPGSHRREGLLETARLNFGRGLANLAHGFGSLINIGARYFLAQEVDLADGSKVTIFDHEF